VKKGGKVLRLEDSREKGRGLYIDTGVIKRKKRVTRKEKRKA